MDDKYTDYIEHQGVVTGVDARRGIVSVLVDDSGDCGACPASKLCRIAGSTGEKAGNSIEVETSDASQYKTGDKVIVRGTERMHRRAIMLATVFPSIALVAVMVGVFLLTGNQLMAAICGIGVTIIFFILLYLCRNIIAHEFSFSISTKLTD